MNTKDFAKELVDSLGDIEGRFNISREQAMFIASLAKTEAEFIAIWEEPFLWDFE